MREIKLSNGEFTVIDDEDYEKVKQYKWYKHSGGYACTSVNKRNLYMHRFINNTPEGMFTDHANGNKLDNRRANLRTCTPYQNSYNAAKNNGEVKYRGVTLDKRKKKYQARIKIESYHKHLGLFDTKEEAALAYNIAAEKYHGEFAKLNHGITQQLTIFDFGVVV